MTRRSYILGLLLPLTGCALWSDFQAPKTELPEHWKTDAKTDAAKAWPDADWWKQFKSSQLAAQIDQANSANYDLKAAIARVQQADAQVRINGATLLPSVDASAGASRNRAATGSSVSSRSRSYNAYNANLNAAYEIDFWGKNWSSAESARALAEASRFDQETVTLTILSSVATNYFDTIGTQERIKVAKENLKNAEQLADTIHKRFNAGIATALDIAQQDSVVASERAVVPPLEQHLQQDLDAQAILLGKMPETIENPNETFADITVPVVAAGLPSELLERRPDVQNAQSQLAAAHADIITARANFFPSIQLTAAGGYQSAALGQLFRPDSMLWSLGASVVQPIFEGGRLRGALDLEKARYDELLQQYRKSVVSAFSDVEDMLIAVRKTDEEEQAQHIAVETARRAYKLSQQQLSGGIIDITTVLNTQRTLFGAEDAWVQAKLQHLQAVVGLYRALGGGWKSDQASTAPVVDAPLVTDKKP